MFDGGLFQGMIQKQKPSFWSLVGDFARDFLPFGNLIDSGIGLISGISNNIYDRQLQERLFQRDDTSLDRTMAMYQRNGINPLMALPNAQATNTKGFEPSSVSSNFNQSYINHMQKEGLKQQQTKMWLDNAIAREDLAIKKSQADLANLNAQYEGRILRGKINAMATHKKDFYNADSYIFPYPDEGVYPLEPKTETEKLLRAIASWLFGEKDNRLHRGDSSDSKTTDGSSPSEKYKGADTGKTYSDLQHALADRKLKQVGDNEYQYKQGKYDFRIFYNGAYFVVDNLAFGSLDEAFAYCDNIIKR